MTRFLIAAFVLGLLGTARAQDVVYYFDRAAKKEAEHKGVIEDETPAGIKIKVREGKDESVKLVPTEIITQVLYGQKDIDRLTYRSSFGRLERAAKESGKAREKSLAEALDGFTKNEALLGSSPRAKRYFQYKAAEVTAILSQDDPAKIEPAIKLLSDFRTAHPTSWQIVPALKTLAKLQEVAGKTDDARESYEALADLPDIPQAVKQESAVLVGKLLLRGGKHADAEKRLKSLASSLSAADALTPFVKAYLVECRLGRNDLAGVPKELEGVIKGSDDARLRAVAHNLLGDYYLKKAQPDEAFWHFLRVDAVYIDDPEEHAKALYHLVGLFDKVKKDPVRGKDCADKLLGPAFAGTVYQRKLAAEAKK